MLIFKSCKESRILPLSLCLWKNIYFVLSAFRDSLFIEHHSKSFLVSLLAISNRSFMLLCEEKSLCRRQALLD